MKKLLLAAVGITGLLAGCGDVSVGNTKVSITDIKTEYRTADGRYVGCDAAGTSTKTQVGVYFTASGVVSSLTVNLKGLNSSANDAPFVGTATGAELANIGTNKFKFTFDADSTKNLLPASIVVNPAGRYIKIVSVDDANKVGRFYVSLTLTTPDGQATGNTLLMPGGVIDVYSTCTVTGTTTETP